MRGVGSGVAEDFRILVHVLGTFGHSQAITRAVHIIVITTIVTIASRLGARISL